MVASSWCLAHAPSDRAFPRHVKSRLAHLPLHGSQHSNSGLNQSSKVPSKYFEHVSAKVVYLPQDTNTKPHKSAICLAEQGIPFRSAPSWGFHVTNLMGVIWIHELQSLDRRACANLDLLNVEQLVDQQMKILRCFPINSFRHSWSYQKIMDWLLMTWVNTSGLLSSYFMSWGLGEERNLQFLASQWTISMTPLVRHEYYWRTLSRNTIVSNSSTILDMQLRSPTASSQSINCHFCTSCSFCSMTLILFDPPAFYFDPLINSSIWLATSSIWLILCVSHTCK